MHDTNWKSGLNQISKDYWWTILFTSQNQPQLDKKKGFDMTLYVYQQNVFNKNFE